MHFHQCCGAGADGDGAITGIFLSGSTATETKWVFKPFLKFIPLLELFIIVLILYFCLSVANLNLLEQKIFIFEFGFKIRIQYIQSRSRSGVAVRNVSGGGAVAAN